MTTRGCGGRVAGGIYLTTPKDPNGVPLYQFLIDPPRPLDLDTLNVLGVSAQGMSPLPGGDVMDWIGEKHYPNVWDFIAEAGKFGISRRIPRTFDFSLLKLGARLYTIHPFGWIAPGRDLDILQAVAETACPKKIPCHTYVDGRPAAMCIGLHRECVEGGEVMSETWDPRLVRRTIGDTTYCAYQTPENVSLTFSPALIAAWPIHHIEVVRDLEDGSHEGAFGKAGKSEFLVEVVDE